MTARHRLARALALATLAALSALTIAEANTRPDLYRNTNPPAPITSTGTTQGDPHR